MLLSIVIPIYNEQDTLKDNITEIYNFFSTKIIFEIIAVNDGSTDNSLDILRRLDLPN